MARTEPVEETITPELADYTIKANDSPEAAVKDETTPVQGNHWTWKWPSMLLSKQVLHLNIDVSIEVSN